MDTTLDTEESPWGFHETHLLLPLLCAASVALVLMVLVCCLTRRHTRIRSKHAERSMDISNDTSEVGICDIRNEILTTSHHKTPSDRYNRQLSPLLAAQAHSVHKNKAKLEANDNPLFSMEIKQDPLCRQTRELNRWGSPDTHNVAHSRNVMHRQDWDLSLTHTGCKGEAVIEDAESGADNYAPADTDQEGDYETLDRFWHLKSAMKGRIADSPNSGKLSNSRELTVVEQKERTMPDAQVFHQTNSLISPRNVTKHTGGNNCRVKILCQLSLFDLSTADIASVYYNTDSLAVDKDNLLTVLRNSRLLVLPQSSENMDLLQALTTGVLLSPVRMEEEHSNALHQSSSVPPFPLSGLLNKQSHLSKPHNSALSQQSKLEKLDRFLETHSPSAGEDHRIYSHQSMSRDMDTTRNDVKLGSKPVIFAEASVAKILSKLGPLPPLPPGEVEAHVPLPEKSEISHNPHPTLASPTSFDITTNYTDRTVISSQRQYDKRSRRGHTLKVAKFQSPPASSPNCCLLAPSADSSYGLPVSRTSPGCTLPSSAQWSSHCMSASSPSGCLPAPMASLNRCSFVPTTLPSNTNRHPFASTRSPSYYLPAPHMCRIDNNSGSHESAGFASSQNDALSHDSSHNFPAPLLLTPSFPGEDEPLATTHGKPTSCDTRQLCSEASSKENLEPEQNIYFELEDDAAFLDSSTESVHSNDRYNL